MKSLGNKRDGGDNIYQSSRERRFNKRSKESVSPSKTKKFLSLQVNQKMTVLYKRERD